MKISSNTRLLGLFGNPSRHSLSPLIQNTFIEHYGMDCAYLVFEPSADTLKKAFFGAMELGFIGLNITMPFKEEIFGLLNSSEGPASFFKAVNTVKFMQHKSIATGYSTDGEGVIKSLEDACFDLEGKSCIVIGAGGAAKSAIYAMLSRPVESVYLFDIDRQKPVLIENLFKSKGKIKIIKDINKIEEKFINSIDLIINCSPAGMKIKGIESGALAVPASWNLKNKAVFDMVYEPLMTPLVKKAENDGAKTIVKGLEMLINQAAYSFYIWFGIMPGQDVIKEIKNNIVKKIWN